MYPTKTSCFKRDKRPTPTVSSFGVPTLKTFIENSGCFSLQINHIFFPRVFQVSTANLWNSWTPPADSSKRDDAQMLMNVLPKIQLSYGFLWMMHAESFVITLLKLETLQLSCSNFMCFNFAVALDQFPPPPLPWNHRKRESPLGFSSVAHFHLVNWPGVKDNFW